MLLRKTHLDLGLPHIITTPTTKAERVNASVEALCVILKIHRRRVSEPKYWRSKLKTSSFIICGRLKAGNCMR